MLNDPYNNNYHSHPEVEDEVGDEVGDGRGARMSMMPSMIGLQPLRWRLVEGSKEGSERAEEGEKGALSGGGNHRYHNSSNPSSHRHNVINNSSSGGGSSGSSGNGGGNGGGNSQPIGEYHSGQYHPHLHPVPHPHQERNTAHDDGGDATVRQTQTLRQSFLRFYETHQQDVSHKNHDCEDGVEGGDGKGDEGGGVRGSGNRAQLKPPMVLSDGCIVTLTHPVLDVIDGIASVDASVVSHESSVVSANKPHTTNGVNTLNGVNTPHGINHPPTHSLENSLTHCLENTPASRARASLRAGDGASLRAGDGASLRAGDAKSWTVHQDRVRIVTVDYLVSLSYPPQPQSSSSTASLAAASAATTSLSPPPNYLTIDNDETLLLCLELMKGGATKGYYPHTTHSNTSTNPD